MSWTYSCHCCTWTLVHRTLKAASKVNCRCLVRHLALKGLLHKRPCVHWLCCVVVYEFKMQHWKCISHCMIETFLSCVVFWLHAIVKDPWSCLCCLNHFFRKKKIFALHITELFHTMQTPLNILTSTVQRYYDTFWVSCYNFAPKFHVQIFCCIFFICQSTARSQFLNKSFMRCPQCPLPTSARSNHRCIVEEDTVFTT